VHNKQATERATSVAISRMYAMHAMLPDIARALTQQASNNSDTDANTALTQYYKIVTK